MNINEKCRCGATIEIDDPTASIINTTTRDALGDFRAGHSCSYRGVEESETVMASPAKPMPF